MTDVPPNCPHEPDAVAWLQGELPSEQGRTFERHLATCASCSAFTTDARRLLVGVRDVNRRRRDSSRTVLRFAVAAAFLGVLIVLTRSGPPAPPAEALAWVESRQGADGSWDPASWQGLQSNRVGIQALALLALSRAEAEHPDPQRRRRLERGARWLQSQQDDTGLFTYDAADPEHAVATLALVEIYARTEAPDVRAAAIRAVDVLPRAATRRPSADRGESFARLAQERAAHLGLTAEDVARSMPSRLEDPGFWTRALGADQHAAPAPGPTDDLFAASRVVLMAPGGLLASN